LLTCLASSFLKIGNQTFRTDEWTNVPSGILEYLPRRLHLQESHPISLTRKLIESRFPSPTFNHYNDFSPIVSTYQNFDALGFPSDHPGRSKTDTYYINAGTCLRTHTSAHQAETFSKDSSDGYTITADVYRRDAIDRSHYPVFHQMECARLWDRAKVPDGDIAKAVNADIALLPKHDLVVEDPNPTVHPERNPLQTSHSLEEVQAISTHLKRSLEDVVVTIFTAAKSAALTSDDLAIRTEAEQPLRVRWVEAYFPFTSPSWELEVFWQGDWLELLGSGVIQQPILNNANVPSKLGWAFGLGVERIAMLLYSIPDIRLFWSQDPRFLSQFSTTGTPRRFVPFSKYPGCPRDVAFWVQNSSSPAGGKLAPSSSFHENDVMQLVRDVGGDLVEDVRLVDEFVHPKTGRRSYCYNINYRSLERVISRDEANELHESVRKGLVERLGVELR
jgi:phenylalanyl-tRNA synthetase alpha chain